MSRKICVAIALAITCLMSSFASASPTVIGDHVDTAATFMGGDYGSYSSATFANRVDGGKHWGDEIADPNHRFDTTQITVDRDSTGNTITFTLHTRFNGDDRGAHYVDLFLNTNSPSILGGSNYAIALGNQTMTAGLYALGSASTSNDIWGGQSSFVYGGFAQLDTSSSGFDPNAAAAVYTRLNSGTQMTDYAVTVTQQTAGEFFDVSVVLAAATNLDLFNAFSIMWGTGDCANDVIAGSVTFAPVRAPQGLTLLCLGLLAATWMRRRVVFISARTDV